MIFPCIICKVWKTIQFMILLIFFKIKIIFWLIILILRILIIIIFFILNFLFIYFRLQFKILPLIFNFLILNILLTLNKVFRILIINTHRSISGCSSLWLRQTNLLSIFLAFIFTLFNFLPQCAKSQKMLSFFLLIFKDFKSAFAVCQSKIPCLVIMIVQCVFIMNILWVKC